MIYGSEITGVAVAENRFMPAGESVRLYNANGAESLTLGQLANAVSVRLAVVYEMRSVLVMNEMCSENESIEAMSSVAAQIVGDSVTGYGDAADVDASYEARTEAFRNDRSIKSFLVNECGIESSQLPSDITSFDGKMSAYKLLKEKLDAATSQSQDLAITLKTCVSRRDVAYSTSTNISKHYTASLVTLAGQL